MIQFRKIPVFALCCLGVLLLAESGCVSGRIETTLIPAREPELCVPDSRFYIADLNYVSPQSPTSAKQNDAICERFKKECLSAYPNLFAASPEGAVPLSVAISQTNKVYLGKTMGWMYGTLLICGLILPCPGQTDEMYEISVRVRGNPSAAPGATGGFRNEYHTWCSILTPAALIEIPGESDFPKMSGSIFNMKPMMEEYYQGTSRQLAAAVAHAVVGAGPELTKLAANPAPAVVQAEPPVSIEKPVDLSVTVATAPAPVQQAAQVAVPAQPAQTPVADVPTQLKKLDELKALGLITEDEYQARKAELIEKP